MLIRRLGFIAAESVLLASFWTVSAYMLRSSSVSVESPFSIMFAPDYGPSQMAVAVAIGVGAYWLFQLAGSPQSVFWALAIPGLLAQGPTIMSHNVLDWSYFFVEGSLFSSDLSLVRTAALFLSSLVLLVMLHKVIHLRNLRAALHNSQVDASDADRLVLSKISALGAIVASGLLLSGFMMYLAGLIGRGDQLFGYSSWTVLMVGGGAIVLVGVLPLLWILQHREN